MLLRARGKALTPALSPRRSVIGRLGLPVLSTIAAETPLTFQLQTRSRAGVATTSKESWLPSRTAIIVCDMWDLHHCRNAVVREGEMAPRMNEVLEQARDAGVLIIHAPRSCMKAYEDTTARERAIPAPPAAWLTNHYREFCHTPHTE